MCPQWGPLRVAVRAAVWTTVWAAVCPQWVPLVPVVWASVDCSVGHWGPQCGPQCGPQWGLMVPAVWAAVRIAVWAAVCPQCAGGDCWCPHCACWCLLFWRLRWYLRALTSYVIPPLVCHKIKIKFKIACRYCTCRMVQTMIWSCL